MRAFGHPRHQRTQTATRRPQEFAWRVHDALNDWTGKVDFKASIVLALEAGILTAVITLSAEGGPFHNLGGLRETLFRAGLSSAATAVVLAGWVVFPQLRRREARQNWRSNWIYFGHLRHWDPDQLAETLAAGEPHDLQQLARQLVTMSQIAWQKHARLQYSLLLLGAGVALLLPAGIAV